MNTEQQTAELAKYDVPAAQIEAWEANASEIVIDGIKDKASYDHADELRKIVKRARLKVESTRKELKAEALAYGRVVDGEAKRLTALLEPVEALLKSKTKAIDDEKARMKREREEAEARELAKAKAEAEAETRRRYEALLAVGYNATAFELEILEPDDYEELLRTATEQHAAKAEAEAAAQAEREAEAAKLAAEREAIEAEKASLAAERKIIDDAKAAVAKAAKDKADAAQREKDKAEEDRLKREAHDKARIEAETRAFERAKLEERRRPIIARCGEFAEVVRGLAVPEGLPEELAAAITEALDDTANIIVGLAEESN